ncbi:MAG: DUF3054 domain-containing protein [Actinomycetota bacterium]
MTTDPLASPDSPTAPAGARRGRWARVAGPLLCDLAVVTVFVVIGRRSHDEGSDVAGLLRVWWPFAVALGVSGVASGAWRFPFRWGRVVALWLGTVALGMVGRIVIQGRELKPSFVVVTAVFFALGMFGWRLVARWWARHRATG